MTVSVLPCWMEFLSAKTGRARKLTLLDSSVVCSF